MLMPSVLGLLVLPRLEERGEVGLDFRRHRLRARLEIPYVGLDGIHARRETPDHQSLDAQPSTSGQDDRGQDRPDGLAPGLAPPALPVAALWRRDDRRLFGRF